MNCERELSVKMSGFFIQDLTLKPFLHPAKANAQCDLLVAVAQAPKQPFHLVSPAPCGADDSLCRNELGLAVGHAFQQKTFKLAAILRPVSVNAATATVESSARLLELRAAQPGRTFQHQPKRAQPFGIVVRLQLAVGKDHAVAAQAAFQAELIRIDRSHFATSKIMEPEAKAMAEVLRGRLRV